MTMTPPRAFDPAVEQAHATLWERFFTPEGVILDYVGAQGEVLLPTVEECLTDRPNALSWGCPNENGPMFGGAYLEGALDRWRLTGSPADAAKVRTVVSGLEYMHEVGETPGFVARGVADDGRTHYALSSNDQLSPWVVGLWRFLQSDLPTAEERARVRGRVVAVCEAISRCGWRVPCERPPFDFRGDFTRFHFEGAPRVLFLALVMAHLTGQAAWEREYERLLDEADPRGGMSRLELCRQGMVFEAVQGWRHSWTSAGSVTCLRGLWELETDSARKAAYAEGLRKSAEVARDGLHLVLTFDNADTSHFEINWRLMNELWREQQTVADAVEVAEAQLRHLGAVSPRRHYEAMRMREPLYAAWIVTLCPETEFVAPLVPEILQVLRHYDYRKLYTSQFFPAEAAYYRLLWEHGLVEAS